MPLPVASPGSIERSVPGYVPGPISSALLASLPLLMILVLTPAHIYVGNQPDFDYEHVVIFHLSLFHLFAVLGFYLVFRVIPRLRKPISYPLAVTGVFLLAVHLVTLSPTDFQLHSGIYFVEESSKWALFEVGVLSALWVLVRFCSASKLVDIASLLCALLIVAVPGVVAYEAARADQSVAGWMKVSSAGPARIADSPNVYHFVFDGFEGSLFERIVSELDLESSLAGFVWYSNAFSDYITTRLSFPSFMNGRLYDKATLNEAGGKLTRTEGLVKTLASKGYKVTQYNAYYINNHAIAHERHSTTSIEADAYGNLRRLVQLLDLSVLLATPQVLKAQTAIDGRGLFSHWFLRTRHAYADWTRNPPLLSLMLLDQLLKDERRRPARGQYVNAHFLIPHAPESLTAECQYAPAMSRLVVNLAEQTICTVVKIREIADTLRALDRFRDAMIVIHSDHGTLRPDRPLVLVKYPGAQTEPFRIARHEVQLIDIAPTILDALGLDHADLDGVNLQNDEARARPTGFERVE